MVSVPSNVCAVCDTVLCCVCTESLEVVELDFGEHTPVVSNMRVLDVVSGKEKTADSDTCTVIVNFDITIPSPDSNIVLRARVGGTR